MDEQISSRYGAKKWLAAILIGLAGQLAWAIENQYINLWVYSQTGDSTYIHWMTVASSIIATLTTFFMGALSDRLGKRKIFISGGYIIWGVTVFMFGLMSYGNMKFLFPAANTLFLVGLMNTIVDSVMTFFGSTANDACFNAYITDTTNTHNRPKVESVLSVLPLFGTALMLGAGMVFGIPGEAGVSAQEIATPWLYFFLSMGVFVTLIGVVSIFLLPKDELEPNKEPYLQNLIYGFRPSVIKKNPLFYIALLAFMFFNIACDSWMPYYLVYFQTGLELDGGAFYLAMALILLISSAVTVVLGFFMDRIGKLRIAIPALLVLAIGSLMLFLLKIYPLVILSATLMMSGYLLGTAVLGAQIRDETPKEGVGLFQGVRMVGAVLIPMTVGSTLSQWSFQTSALNEYGEMAKVPDRNMFLVTMGAALLAILPTIWLIIKDKKRKKAVENIDKEEPKQ